MNDLLTIIDGFTDKNEDYPLIFVTGPSGSGKTTLCQQAAAERNIPVVSLDWWIIDSSPVRRRKIMEEYAKTKQPPHPLDWYDWAAFREGLQTLQTTGHLRLNNAWNQSSGEKDLDISITATPGQCILVEGVYLFEPSVKDLTSSIVLIDSDIDLAIKHALQRQAHRNPGEYLSVKALWYKQFDKPYIEQHRFEADVVVPSFTKQ